MKLRLDSAGQVLVVQAAMVAVPSLMVVSLLCMVAMKMRPGR